MPTIATALHCTAAAAAAAALLLLLPCCCYCPACCCCCCCCCCWRNMACLHEYNRRVLQPPGLVAVVCSYALDGAGLAIAITSTVKWHSGSSCGTLACNTRYCMGFQYHCCGYRNENADKVTLQSTRVHQSRVDHSSSLWSFAIKTYNIGKHLPHLEDGIVALYMLSIAASLVRGL